ncbi:MAG: response regulator [Myxococcaceae bacterium]
MSHAQPQVLFAEPLAPIGNALRKFLDGWAEVQLTSSLELTLEAVRAKPPDVLLIAVAQGFDGESLVPEVRKAAPETAIILVYPNPEVERAAERARAAQAEGFLVMPLKKHVVVGLVQAVMRLNVLAAQLRGLQAKVESIKTAPKAVAIRPSQVGLNAPDEAFFKKYMLLEVKRSKRYQYPVALLLVSLDNLTASLGDSAPEFQRAAIRSEAIEVLSALLRDIDVAMPFAEDKYLLFLPHTPLKGATVVAGRVVERLSKLDSFPKGTVSVGVASYDPSGKSKEQTKKDQVSFGGLVRQAGESLKKAQGAGGGRYEAPEAPAAAKRSRISMG